jgi:hypothetical protein
VITKGWFADYGRFAMSGLWRLLLAVLLIALLGANGTQAQPLQQPSGVVASAATPSSATPSVGEQIVVTINVDMSGVNSPDNKLGSLTGSLDWNPAVLAYHSDSGMLAGFTGLVNTNSVAAGHIVFNGANPGGATGNVIVLTITFDVVGAGTCVLDLGYTAMSAATTFANLWPILAITDGEVVVATGLDGDLDADCDVDIVDIMLVASRWGSTEGSPNYDPRYDLDRDGDIDIVDIMTVAQHWGDVCSTR